MPIFDFLKGWFGKKSPHNAPQAAMTPAAIRGLLERLERTLPEELSCEEVYDLVDQYADLVQSEGDAAGLLPLVEHHLEMCMDCKEEFEALMRALRASADL
jgi:hypothetical protein